MPKEAKILATVGLLVLLGAVALIIVKPSTTPAPKVIDSTVLTRANSHTVAGNTPVVGGISTTKVSVVEFGDYQCPACAYAHPIFKKVIAEYASNPNVSFTFRNYPLPMHSNAMISAEAAEAAASQGKFWEMHDMLYEKQSEWSEVANAMQYFSVYAKNIGLDVTKFEKEIKDNTHIKAINADVADGDSVDVHGTPTFFINGAAFGTGNVPTFEEFKAKIDSLLI